MSSIQDKDHSLRATSFGRVAQAYERFRPPIPEAALDWLLPAGCRCVLDLGAGTGACTRLLVRRVPEVLAVEPDPRMRALIARHASGAQILAGKAESLPLEDGRVDAVLVCSAWHWMDPGVAVPEIGRVLRPGGTFGILWNGLDRDAPEMAVLEHLRTEMGYPDPDEGGRPHRPEKIVLPAGSPFRPPEIERVAWNWTTTVDGLLGLLGTHSHLIILDPTPRAQALARARELLEMHFGGGGDRVIDVPMACRCWRAMRF
jgi:SAM-dependent methyltransferase